MSIMQYCHINLLFNVAQLAKNFQFLKHEPIWFYLCTFQVKLITEEAVMRKFVHEESGSVTSLCGKLLVTLKYFKF